MFGPMVLFAAATGLRPSEQIALEQGESIGSRWRAGSTCIRERASQQTKTRLSRRAAPLQAIALEALVQLTLRDESSLLFPNTRGGHVDFRIQPLHWKPVQETVGIDPLHDGKDRLHTYPPRSDGSSDLRSLVNCAAYGWEDHESAEAAASRCSEPGR